MVIATIVGARLGHVIFYSPEMFLEKPLQIFLPIEFNPIRFTGLQGLASHGGAFAILFALWLYARKKKPGQSYLQVVDRIVILVALTGALIRLGNYFNSEIIGKPSDVTWSVVFANGLSERLENVDTQKAIESIDYERNDSINTSTGARVPMTVVVTFQRRTTEDYADVLLHEGIKYMNTVEAEHFDAESLAPTTSISKTDKGQLIGRIHTLGISRHPAQMYESIACVILFILLYLIWNRYKADLPPGRLLGIFLIWCFGLRFLFEYLKEVQVEFEETLPINMGQILSIPLIIAGIVILVLSYRKKAI
jgi:prolipoprotein diacylglyceryltransferase